MNERRENAEIKGQNQASLDIGASGPGGPRSEYHPGTIGKPGQRLFAWISGGLCVGRQPGLSLRNGKRSNKGQLGLIRSGGNSGGHRHRLMLARV